MRLQPNLGLAWLLLTFSFAIHVVDEALNDFLLLWNPIAKLSGFLPVFTFTSWLILLILAILILFFLSSFAYKERKWICYISLIYGLIMFLNSIGHTYASYYFKDMVAGIYSSPLLFIFSIFLIWSAIKTLMKKVVLQTTGLE